MLINKKNEQNPLILNKNFLFRRKGLSRKEENSSFKCKKCGFEVEPLNNGSYRNHCPNCLYSLHVDVIPGERKSSCLGLMEPIDLIYNTKKGYQIVHKCQKCGQIQKNRIADNCNQPDNIMKLYEKYK